MQVAKWGVNIPKTSNSVFSGILVNRVTSWDPLIVYCRIKLKTWYYRCSSLQLLSKYFHRAKFPSFHFPLSLFSFLFKISDHISSSPFPTVYVQKVWSTKWGWDEHSVIKNKIPRPVRLFTGDCELCHHRNLHRQLSLFSWSSPRCKLCSLPLNFPCPFSDLFILIPVLWIFNGILLWMLKWVFLVDFFLWRFKFLLVITCFMLKLKENKLKSQNL